MSGGLIKCDQQTYQFIDLCVDYALTVLLCMIHSKKLQWISENKPWYMSVNFKCCHTVQLTAWKGSSPKRRIIRFSWNLGSNLQSQSRCHVNQPSSQSAVCPIHCVFLQTRCHVWDVKLHVTVALLLTRVTWAFFGGSGLAQPVAVTALSYYDNCHLDNATLRFILPSTIIGQNARITVCRANVWNGLQTTGLAILNTKKCEVTFQRVG